MCLVVRCGRGVISCVCVHCGGVQYVNHKAFAIRPIFAILKSQEYFRANLSYYMVQSRMYNFTSIDIVFAFVDRLSTEVL